MVKVILANSKNNGNYWTMLRTYEVPRHGR